MTYVFQRRSQLIYLQVLLRIRAETDARDKDGGPNLATAQSPVKQQHRGPTAGLRLHSFHVPELQQVVANHFSATRSPELVAGGNRPLALVYFLVAALVATHNYAVVVVDVEARFDVRRLLCMRPVVHIEDADNQQDETNHMRAVCEADLQHVHVFRTDPRWRTSLRELVATAEQRALYGMQRRRDRPLWGTIAIGNSASGTGMPSGADSEAGAASGAGTGASVSHGAGAALATGYYGWLRVDALQQQEETREERLAALLHDVHIDAPETPPKPVPIIWTASSPWGGFAFGLSGRPEMPRYSLS